MAPSLLLFLHLPLWALWGGSSQGLSTPLTLEGDYTITGLFPIHRKNIIQSQKSKPEVDVCKRCSPYDNRNVHGYHLVQAMRFAVEEINNSSCLLPNLTLGYEIYDSCTSSTNMYATLSLLSQDREGCIGHQQVEVDANYARYLPKAVAAVGPDSSDEAVLTASLLGNIRIPVVSYEATSTALSNKRLYPSFLRTVPTNYVQSCALIHLLEAFNWTWVAVVASNDHYGLQAVEILQDMSAEAGVCFAYQGVLPSSNNPNSLEEAKIVHNLVSSGASVTIVYANRESAASFFQVVVRLNVTGKVWLGTEDWSLASDISMIHGIHGIGTVIGVSLKQAYLWGMKTFEAALVGCKEATGGLNDTGSARSSCQHCREACSQLCTQFCRPDKWEPSHSGLEISPRDSRAIFNVYSAVYTVAHGLHRLLDCQTGECRKDTIYPWQLLKEMRQANFSLFHRQVRFDTNGDILDGYELVLWNWAGQTWNYSVIGSYDNSGGLSIDKEKLLWHTEENQVPVSVCSLDCGPGEEKIQQGTQRCCFHCLPCSSGTFLNKSSFSTCQKCKEDQWSPAGSEACFDRSVEFLAWDERVSLVLLTCISLGLLLMVGTGALFIWHLQTPVVKSAGGWLAVVMLCSLACASFSLYASFGVPSKLSCLLRSPLFNVSFAICLSCMAARSFQIVIIFKMATKTPGLLEAWRRHHGSSVLIGSLTAVQGVITLMHLSIRTPVPQKNYDAYDNVTVLECSVGDSTLCLSGLLYNTLLGISCFVISYMGKDLPSSYNEAKCITFSLLIYFASLVTYSVTRSIDTGQKLLTMYVVSHFTSLCGIFGNYFVPKVYIILFHSERNTSEHFQMSIQSYTKRINAAG
ncbi:taste receptor type 1 member 1 [Pogona vitticeps]